MKDEDIDQRHAAAYHEAGQAVMAFYLGGWVNDAGVAIDERRYCGLSLPFEHDAQTKERFLLLCDLAGWRAEHLWHGKGSSRDGYPDEELCCVARPKGNLVKERDDLNRRARPRFSRRGEHEVSP
jgi:hypothetical protein